MEDRRIDMRKKQIASMAEAKAKTRARAEAEADAAALPHKNESDAMSVDAPETSTSKLEVPVAPVKAASPAPASLPPDDKIMEHEEVSADYNLHNVCLLCHRQSNVYHGSHYVPPARTIYTISSR